MSLFKPSVSRNNSAVISVFFSNSAIRMLHFRSRARVASGPSP
jgi:hypothetical protein